MTTHPLWYATLLSGIVLSAPAQYQRPRPRLARAVPDTVVLRLATNAPVGTLTLPAWRVQPWRVQPWRAGDAASHAGAIYICVQSHAALSNWHPPATPALWRLIRAPGESMDDIPAWIPWQGSGAYQLGAQVRHNGLVWRSTINNNVWEPGVYGWIAVD